ncbi:autotransporter outer membrane beta-barrel domain-containing protein [Hoeflea sp.]|uniref:autotransporter family protein n=1 Tax=Hoeflea sp. TaxID=1940281 RepID=UPI003B01BDCC
MPFGALDVEVDGGIVSGTDGIFLDIGPTTTSTLSILPGGTVRGTGTTADDRAVDIVGGATHVTLAGNVIGGGGGAIQFAPGTFTDRLELQPGFAATGIVFADAGFDTLRYGGAGNGAFDLSLIDTGTNTRQYRQFEAFEVNSGVWTFSNATTASFVANGGVLTGNATLGGLTINNGATLAPGVGLGTMNVTGNVAFYNGAIFAVDLRPDGTADLLDVTGTVTIASGGTVFNAVLDPLVIPADPTTWTLIRAGGGVTGQFAAVTDNLPDIDLQAVYSPNSVQLKFVAGPPPGSLSPKEIHPSASMAALESSLLFVETLRRRSRLLAAGRTDDGLADAVFGFVPGIERVNERQAGNGAADIRDGAVWGAAIGADTDVNADGATPGWKAREAGFAFGLERRFQAGAEIPASGGFAAGYISTDVQTGDSVAHIDSWHAGVYGTATTGRLTLSGAASYAHHRFDFDRFIPVGADVMFGDGKAGGNSVAGSFAAFHDLAGIKQNGVRFGPLATLDAAYVDRGGFTESGAGILNLTVGSDSASQAVTGLGAAIGINWNFGKRSVAFDAGVQWEHVFGDTNVTTASVLSVPDAAFLTSSAPIDRNRLAVGIGMAIDVSETFSAHVRYDGAFGPNTTSQDGSAGLTLRF